MTDTAPDPALFGPAIAAAAGLRAGSSRTVAALTVAVVVLLALLGVSVVTTASLMKGPREIHHVVLVDRVTGESRRLTAGDGVRTASEDRFVHEAWLARYVVLRERYLWETVQDDARLVGLWSAPDVEAEYDEWVRGPTAPVVQFKDKKRISVTIDSIEPDERGEVGRVRFTLRTRDVDEPISEAVVTRHSATIGYRFDADAVMYDDDRLANELGFQVTAYDVVGETSNRGLSAREPSS